MSQLLSFVAPIAALAAVGLGCLALPTSTPLSADELAEMAIVYMKVSDPRAERTYQAAEAIATDHVRTNFGRAIFAYDQNDLTGAEGYLKRVIAKDPDHYEARITLGALYQKLKRYDEAKEIYLQLGKREPLDSRLYYNLGHLEIQQDRYAEALPYLKGFLRLQNAQTPGYKQVMAEVQEIEDLLARQKGATPTPSPARK